MAYLDFKGKSAIYSHHLSVPFRPLVIDSKKSLSRAKESPLLEDNLIIHGDNLEALKALLPQYAGKIKLIYIDPPYNTGNEGWAYNDNVNSPLLKAWLKKTVDQEDQERHDKWLCMMWPRLQLLKELLTEDGIIFISIDDHEQSNLDQILKEIFNEENFLGRFIWKSRQQVDSRNITRVSSDHEYVIAYAKSNSGKIKGKMIDKEKYTNPDNDQRGPWMNSPLDGVATKAQRPNLHYVITNPKTKLKYSPSQENGWRFSKERMESLITDNRIIWPKNEKSKPRFKRYLNELTNEYTGFSTILDVSFTSEGTRELRNIMEQETIKFPKPVDLIKTLIQQANDSDCIILDSFAGSGTTAHATLVANKEDGGKRKFILIECEDYADKITAERVRRVMKGVPSAKDDVLKNGLGGSFTYCTLGEPIELDSLLKGKNLPLYEDLAKYVFFNATGKTLQKVAKPNTEYFIGETDEYRVHLIYKPDIKFLRSNEAALNEKLAERIESKTNTKKNLVFAGTKYLSLRELKRHQIEYCQLPFALYKILG